MRSLRTFLSLLLVATILSSMMIVGIFGTSAAELPAGYAISEEEGDAAQVNGGTIIGLIGDTDLDGKVSIKDATAIQKFIAKLIKLDINAEYLADVDFNSVVNIKDATGIQKWLAKYEIENINHVLYLPEATAPETTVATDAPVATTEATADEPATDATEDEIVVTTATADEVETTAASDPAETIASTAAGTDPVETTIVIDVTTIPVTTIEATETTAEKTEATTAEKTEATTETTTTEVKDEFITLYFTNNQAWTVVNVHYWGSASTEWPGEAMEFVETNTFGQDVYKCEVPAGVEGVIFNGAVIGSIEGNHVQTIDIKENLENNKGFYTTEQDAEGKWNVDVYDYIPEIPETSEVVSSEATGDEEPTTEATTAAPDLVESIYYLRGIDNNWDPGRVMYLNEDGSASITLSLSAGLYEFKIYDSVEALWYGNDGTMEDTAEGWTFRTDAEIGNCKLNALGGDYTFKCYFNDEGKFRVDVTKAVVEDSTVATDDEETTTSTPDEEATTTVTDKTTATVYFTNIEGWDVVNVYYWGSSSTEWPGEAMEFVKVNKYGQDLYKAEIPTDVDGFLFNGVILGSAEGNHLQTVDIEVVENNKGYYPTEMETGGKWLVESYEILPDEPETSAATTESTDDEVTSESTEATTEADDGMITIYFVKPSNWEDAYIYAYYGEGKNMTSEWTKAYPGDLMNFVETDENGNDIYAYDVPADINVIKFADGSETNRRTDIILTFSDGDCFQVSEEYETNKWYVTKYNYVPDVEETTVTEATEATVTEATTESTDDEVTSEPTDPTESTEATTEADDGMITIYFVKPSNWEDAYIYAYYGEGKNMTSEWTKTYPGDLMNFVETDENGNDIYAYDVPADINVIKFADGSETNRRTDIILTFSDGDCFQVSEEYETNKWYVTEYNYVPDAEETTVTEATEATATDATETTVTEAATDATEAPADTLTVYFKNAKGWALVNIHVRNAEGNITTWPGEAMTFVETAADGFDVYSYEVPANATIIAFNAHPSAADTSNRSNQTENVTGFVDGSAYVADATGNQGYWTVTTWDMNEEDPTEATSTAAATTEATTEATTTEAPTTEAPTVPSGYTSYVINSAKWDVVSAYAWNDGGEMPWPGTVMTKTSDTVNGFDVYSITFDVLYSNLIFNNNNNGSQTANLKFEIGKYYDVKSAKWYTSLSEVPAVGATSTDRYLAGEFNGWSTVSHEFKLKAEGDSVAYVEIELEANKTYEFKVVRLGDWTTCDTAITDTVEGLQFSKNATGFGADGNAKITTKDAGTYVFAFGMNDSKLSVTYP